MRPSFESGGHRPEIRRYGEWDVEVVSGKAYSAANPSVYSPQSRQTVLTEYSIPRKDTGRAGGGGGGGGGGGRSSSGSLWCLSDPEMKRKKRVASYKAYRVEGKIKSSLRKGIRWFKNKCSDLVHG